MVGLPLDSRQSTLRIVVGSRSTRAPPYKLVEASQEPINLRIGEATHRPHASCRLGRSAACESSSRWPHYITLPLRPMPFRQPSPPSLRPQPAASNFLASPKYLRAAARRILCNH